MSVSKAVLFLMAIPLVACSTEVPASRECQSDGDCGVGSFCLEGTCLVDQVNPILTITRPEPGQFFSNKTIDLEGAVTDGNGSGIARTEYSLDGSTFVELSITQGVFAQRIPLPEMDQTGLLVTVRAVDRAGNRVTQTREISIDRKGPSIRMEQPKKTVFNLSDLGSTVEASFYVDDGSGIASVEYSLDAGATWLAPQSTSAFVVGLFEVLPDQPGAEYQLAVRAADAVGNLSKVELEFFVDTLSPLLQTDMDGVTHLGKSAPNPRTVSGTVTDQRLEKLRYQYDLSPFVDLPWNEAGGFELTFALDEAEDGVLH